MRYLAHKPPQADYDYKTFDFDRDIHLLDDWSKQADAKNPDLSKFKKHGGKLLMTHGWADPILQPMMGVNYYEQAVAKNGPETTEFFRLFMVPGMAHCGGGIGPDRHDPMTAMIDWVEKGKAPDSIVASRVVNNQVVRTRPLCAVPAGGALFGPGQHRRRGQLPLRSSLIRRYLSTSGPTTPAERVGNRRFLARAQPTPFRHVPLLATS